MKGPHLCLHHKTRNIVERLVQKNVRSQKKHKAAFQHPAEGPSRPPGRVSAAGSLVGHPSIPPRRRWMCLSGGRLLPSAPEEGKRKHGRERKRGGEATPRAGLVVTLCPCKGTGKWARGSLAEHGVNPWGL